MWEEIFKDQLKEASRYMDELHSKHSEPISRQEELNLFRLYREHGNLQARKKIMNSNMRFVAKVAINYKQCDMPLVDRINEGALGMAKAVEKFEYTRGLKFISYAVWWIRASINKALNEKNNLIRLPSNKYDKLRRSINKVDNISDLCSEDLQSYKTLRGIVSLDNQLDSNGDESSSYEKIVIDPGHDATHELETFIDADRVKYLLKYLEPKQVKVLKLRFGLDGNSSMTLTLIAEVLKLSKERVRQLEQAGLYTLRQLMTKGV